MQISGKSDFKRLQDFEREISTIDDAKGEEQFASG